MEERRTDRIPNTVFVAACSMIAGHGFDGELYWTEVQILSIQRNFRFLRICAISCNSVDVCFLLFTKRKQQNIRLYSFWNGEDNFEFWGFHRITKTHGRNDYINVQSRLYGCADVYVKRWTVFVSLKMHVIISLAVLWKLSTHDLQSFDNILSPKLLSNASIISYVYV